MVIFVQAADSKSKPNKTGQTGKQKGDSRDTGAADDGNVKKLLSAKSLNELEEKASRRKVVDGLNAQPSSNQEKLDCAKILTSQQLRSVVVGPPSVDYGQICLRRFIYNLYLYENTNVFIAHIANGISKRFLNFQGFMRGFSSCLSMFLTIGEWIVESSPIFAIYSCQEA